MPSELDGDNFYPPVLAAIDSKNQSKRTGLTSLTSSSGANTNELTNNEMDQFLSSRSPRLGNLRRMDPGIGSTFNLIISKPSTASEVAAIIDLSSHQSSPTQ
ncbi:hypothetical protein PTTG_29150 [Puccinia triticina 1-1 BBBD Race 1]|uniref:Uncharacterized protein n=1 Tax=Puccinia triticina (isolate 1-1 / race 1 (BBBD)) TaxID=630390 RepID=A0A180G622_PUCT1|nr:hypothetical protein PTTG_29150 [Puccinia triticina 1-1 BBBD Race 1]